MKKHKNKKATKAKLQSTLKYWQKILKISDWTITIDYCNDPSKMDEYTLGQLNCCWTREKVADIYIHPTYHQADGFNIAWNLDTLIIHELIHLIVYERSTSLPEHAQDSPTVMEFEEYICDVLGKIIYDCVKNANKSI